MNGKKGGAFAADAAANLQEHKRARSERHQAAIT